MHISQRLVRRDLWAAAVLVVLGAAGLFQALAYPPGTLSSMGPGYLPRLYSSALVAIGIVLGVKGWFRAGEVAEPTRLMPAAFVALALVAFALSIERLGLFIAVVATTLLASLAGDGFRISRALLLAVVLATVSVLLFVYGLRLPLRAWPV
jgi:Tripartite tricarboxylate transporter TctB family